jgi:hypothetical protein
MPLLLSHLLFYPVAFKSTSSLFYGSSPPIPPLALPCPPHGVSASSLTLPLSIILHPPHLHRCLILLVAYPHHFYLYLLSHSTSRSAPSSSRRVCLLSRSAFIYNPPPTPFPALPHPRLRRIVIYFYSSTSRHISGSLFALLFRNDRHFL